MPPLDPDERLLQQLRSVTRPQAGGPRPDAGFTGRDAGPGADDGFAADGFGDDEFGDDGFGDDEFGDDDGVADPVFARIARIAASLDEQPEPEPGPPPADLWDRIAAAAFDDVAITGAAPGAGEGIGQGSVPAPVVHLDPRRRRPGRSTGRRLPLVAAAAVLAVVAAIGVVAGRDDGGPDVEAEVALAPLESGATGLARLERLPDGRRQLAITEQVGAVPADSYLEVWLIDPDSGLERMVSLGSTDGGATFAIPNGVDPGTYRVVDVSIEPADGNPAHSGRSVLRGTLEI
jgi:hypothetical protein